MPLVKGIFCVVIESNRHFEGSDRDPKLVITDNIIAALLRNGRVGCIVDVVAWISIEKRDEKKMYKMMHEVFSMM